jgi:hypothetical protein
MDAAKCANALKITASRIENLRMSLEVVTLH